MALHANLKQGDMFGRYRLGKFLGAGGFAVVWEAFDSLTNTIVALKIFTTLDDGSIQDLAKEYARVHNLSHPNIVRAEHFDSIRNVPYLVMKFCPGGNLEHFPGKMREMEVIDMIRQISEALVYIHGQGLVHQDIKPGNILTELSDGVMRYLLSDFGISAKSRTRLSKSVADSEQRGLYLTYAYAPPEKFSPVKADRMPDSKGDIFSLGVTAYELATGHLPFDDLDTGRELFYNPGMKIDVGEIHSPLLRDIISACVRSSRDERPDAAVLCQWIGSGKTDISYKATQRAERRPRKVNVNQGKYIPEANTSHREKKFPLLAVSSAMISVLIVMAVAFYIRMEYNQRGVVQYETEPEEYSGSSRTKSVTEPEKQDAAEIEMPVASEESAKKSESPAAEEGEYLDLWESAPDMEPQDTTAQI